MTSKVSKRCISSLVLVLVASSVSLEAHAQDETSEERERVRFQRIRGEAAYVALKASQLPREYKSIVFLSALDGSPYSITEESTGLTCKAPCELRVPVWNDEPTVFRFQTPQRTFSEHHWIENRDLVGFRIQQGGNTIRLIGGGLLVGFGVPSFIVTGLLGFVMSTTAGCDCDDGHHRNEIRNERIADYTLLGMSALNLAAIGFGAYLIHTGRSRVSQIHGTSKNASVDTALDSFRFAIIPTMDGFSAGAGFRF